MGKQPGESRFWSETDDRTAANRYRSLLETVGAGLFHLDSEGRFREVDDELLDATGYSRSALLDSPVSTIFDDDDARRLNAAVDDSDGGVRSHDVAVERADGERLWGEVRFQSLDDGGVVGTVDIADPEPSRPTEAGRAVTTVLDRADIAVFVLDSDFDVAWINDATERYFGLDRAAVLGRDKRRLVHERIRERVARPETFAETVISTYEDNSYAEQFECRVTEGDDRAERWLEHRSKPIPDGRFEGGRIELYYDITGRKRRNQALNEREQALERERDLVDRILEASPTGLMVVDADGEITRVNERYADILGFEPSDVTEPIPESRPIYDVDGRPVSPEDHPLSRALETGEPQQDQFLRIERPGGDYRWISYTARPLLEGGEIDRVVATSKDVTDLKTRKRELESELGDVLGRITDAFYALDDDWQFTHVNDRAEELIDITGEGLTGRNVWEVFEWASDSKLRAEYERAMESQEPTSFELYYPEPLDSWFEINAYPSETGLSVYFQDITERKEREEELELFRSLLDSSRDAVFISDPATGNILDINDTATRHLDYAREELLELTIPDIETELPTRAAWESFVEELKRDGKTTFEGVQQRKDGTTFPVEVNVSYVELDEPYVLSVARDISDREEAKRELRDAKTQLETLFGVLPVGVIVADADGEIVEANDTAREIWGAGNFEAERVDDYDQYDGWWVDTGERVAPEEWTMARVLDGEEVTEPDVIEIERADGEHCTVMIHGMPVRDANGEVVRGVVTHTDITERRAYRRQLEESERRYRSLAENFPNGGVGVFDEDLRYTLVTGTMWDDIRIDADDLEGKLIREALPADTAEDVEPVFRSALQGETGTVVSTLGGRTYRVWATPIRGADGEVIAGQSFAVDITEQLERKRELEESNERLEQFAYAASHDLQEPLRMVSSYLSLIDRRYSDDLDPEAREFLHYAADGADRMREMIDALLEYSRVETQGNPFGPVDLNAVLTDVREDLQMKIAESDADLTVESLPRVRGDEDQLRRVFQNLLGNAIEYSGDEPPDITVSAERNGDVWQLAVHDEGIGIAPDQTDRVFEVFQRLHTHEEHAGTGIGLALCRRIVERHGGDIWVESEPDQWSTFYLTLPVMEESDE